MPKEQSSIIKVIGVGGGGSNAVNHMYKQGIAGVDFVVCNTDAQALDISPVPSKIQLGTNLTEGRGAGSLPEVGKNAALENIEEIMEYLETNTKMVFITAGMGGGTGTGAAPIIAAAAKERGFLTVGIVTIPFTFEGKKRRIQAEEGLNAMRSNVDTLLVICNDRLREMYGNLTLASAFAQADDVLTTAAKGIAEIITVTGYINVDFEDVRTVMTNSGAAIMGSAVAEGENRAIRAAENALASPLLNDNDIKGAQYILLNITSGDTEVLMDEIAEITDYIQDEAGSSADIIWGTGKDESLGNNISVTLIATGFDANHDTGLTTEYQPKKVVRNLHDDLIEDQSTHEPELDLQEDHVAPAPIAQAEKTMEPFSFTSDAIDAETDSQSGAAREITSYGTVTSPEDMADEINGEANDTMDEMTSAPPFTPAGSIEDEIRIEKVPTSEEEQVSIEFDLRPKNDDDLISKKPVLKTVNPPFPRNEESVRGLGDRAALPIENQEKRSQERISKLKEMSYKLRTPSGISDLENEPAYKRRQVELEKTPHSSESQLSRFTLSEGENMERGADDKEDGDGPSKLRPNNPFLHDNVD